jgi:hypothetical protein
VAKAKSRGYERGDSGSVGSSADVSESKSESTSESKNERHGEVDAITVKFIPRHCYSAGMLISRFNQKVQKRCCHRWIAFFSYHQTSSPGRSNHFASFWTKLNITSQQWLDPKQTEAFLVINLGGRKLQSTRSILLPSMIATMMVLVIFQESHKNSTISSRWERTSSGYAQCMFPCKYSPSDPSLTIPTQVREPSG